MDENSPIPQRKLCPLCRDFNLGTAAQCARCGFGFERAPLLLPPMAEPKAARAGGPRCRYCLSETPIEMERCPNCDLSQRVWTRLMQMQDPWQTDFDPAALEGVDILPPRPDLKFLLLGAVALAIISGAAWAVIR